MVTNCDKHSSLPLNIVVTRTKSFEINKGLQITSFVSGPNKLERFISLGRKACKGQKLKLMGPIHEL